MENILYLHRNNPMILKQINSNMFDNQYITALIGGISTLILGYWGRVFITTREKTTLEANQLLTNSGTLLNHTKIISDLQVMVQGMMLNESRMNTELVDLRQQNRDMRELLDTTTSRVEELEKENAQVKKENEILLSKLNLNKL